MKFNRKQQSLTTRRQFLHRSGSVMIGAFALPVLAQSGGSRALDVYKSETCGCCVYWIEHIEQNGYTTTVHHPEDLNGLKEELGVLLEWQSCHTAVTVEGYLFEGHVPARYVSQFLAAPPDNALGLAVPGMPIGSPGMEVGGRLSPYDILLMRKDGRAEVYASIKTAADQ